MSFQHVQPLEQPVAVIAEPARIPTFKMLDALRGLAALWVVMCHCCAIFLGISPRFSSWPIYAFSIKGQLGVVLFFLISGYCITATAYSTVASGKTISRWGFERVRRIYPPYLAACVLTSVSILIQIFAQKYNMVAHIKHLNIGEEYHTVTFWVANALLLQTEAHQSCLVLVSWSLCYEVAFYLIVGLMVWAARTSIQRFGDEFAVICLGLCVGVTTISSLIWLTISPATCPFPLDRWYQFGTGALFFFLTELKSNSLFGFSRKFQLLVTSQFSLTLVLIAVFSLLRQTGGEDVGHPSSRIQAFTLLVFVGLLSVFRRFDRELAGRSLLRPLFGLGAFSYSLYLIHPMLGPYIDFPLRRLGLTGNLYIFTFIVEVVVSVAAGWLFFWAVERHFISSRQKIRFKSELAKERFF